jgi:membrane protein
VEIVIPEHCTMRPDPSITPARRSKFTHRARSWWEILTMTYRDWSEDKAPRLGAALAYYTVFSMAPLLVICMAIAGWLFDAQTVQTRISTELGLSEEGAKGLAAMVEAAEKHEGGLIATIVGIIALLFGATGVFIQLKDALNTIWEVEPKPGAGIWGFIRDRLLSFAMVLTIGFLLLVLLVVSAALHALQEYLGHLLPMPGWVAQIIDIGVSFGGVALLFALIFKYLPDVKIGWRDVWLGAIVTALLFTVGKFLVGLYLGRPGLASAYGAAGALVIILLWAYYSSQILFFGAEFTQVYAKSFGSRIMPSEHAQPVTDEARANQGMPRHGKTSPA